MKILAVTSGKGGVGKSTLTLNIAKQLSSAGKRILLVDFDIHNKGITSLFLPQIPETASSVTSIVHKSLGFQTVNASSIIQELQLIPLTGDDCLFLLPASRPQEMIRWEKFHSENETLVVFFRAFFENVAAKLEFDAIIIDCYGGIDSLTVAATGIADDTIIVNEADLITFSGTLLLYLYIREQYQSEARSPRLHFVINRVTSRHSFEFLDTEYRKHLAQLAIDNRILAYFPYDKLLIETFGDYPFFSELLPKGLFTKKIRLLIEALWSSDEEYKNFSGLSPGNREKVFSRTSEFRFADPDSILRTTMTMPFWFLVPVAILFALSKGIGGSLHYRMIQTAFFTAAGFLGFLALIIGFFEPVQISRWLWREAVYHRRKRRLKKIHGPTYRVISALGEGFRAILPALIAFAFLMAGASYLWKQRSYISHMSLSIWPGEISGFKPGHAYDSLVLHYGARIRPGTNLSNATFTHAHLWGVRFDRCILTKAVFDDADLYEASFSHAHLESARFIRDRLSNTLFSNAFLTGATFEATSFNAVSFQNAHAEGAIFTSASPSTPTPMAVRVSPLFMQTVNFQDANLSRARFTNVYFLGTTFTGANLTNATIEGGLMLHTTFGEDISNANVAGIVLKNISCDDADCELLRAKSAPITPADAYNALTDLTEALILRKKWLEARTTLDKIKSLPQVSTNPTLRSRYLLLSLILQLVTEQPSRQATKDWCAFLAKHPVLNWRWDIWNHEVHKLPLSNDILSQLKLLENSANGDPNARQKLCFLKK